MTIQSLGVGSGLALDDLVTQLLSAEREPKEKRLNDKEEKIEAEISVFLRFASVNSAARLLYKLLVRKNLSVNVGGQIQQVGIRSAHTAQ